MPRELERRFRIIPERRCAIFRRNAPMHPDGACLSKNQRDLSVVVSLGWGQDQGWHSRHTRGISGRKVPLETRRPLAYPGSPPSPLISAASSYAALSCEESSCIWFSLTNATLARSRELSRENVDREIPKRDLKFPRG